MTSLFYSMKFPFRAQTITKGNKKKLLHALSLAVGLLTPFVPTLASVIGFATDAQEELGNTTLSVLVARPQGYGYGMSGYPPILCTAVDRNIIFYLTVLPMGIILGLGGSLLLASMWLIHKASDFVCSYVVDTENKTIRHLLKASAHVEYCYITLLCRKVERTTTTLEQQRKNCCWSSHTTS